jgi:SPX domain protein involved in polyphosphate accumulation
MVSVVSDSKSTPAQLSRFRFERKFVLEDIPIHEALLYIKDHPALFREVFHERQVNNIYLDTYDFKNYHDNVVGSAQRLKARIRWYGALQEESANAQLELKIKQGLLGEKQSWKIADFNLSAGLDPERLAEFFAIAEIPDSLRMNLALLQPTLVNSYRRRYFLSSNGLFRITLDSALEYHRPTGQVNHPNSISDRSLDARRLIIELKYDQAQDDSASSISSFFPFRIAKSSKYVSGLALVNQWEA